jgi:F-box domain
MGIWEEQEVMTPILSRLPEKSVLRFWSVCKLWSLITKNQDFITEHSKNCIYQGYPGIMCINSFKFSPPTLEYFTDASLCTTQQLMPPMMLASCQILAMGLCASMVPP